MAAKPVAKKSPLTAQRARSAAKAAKKKFGNRPLSPTWKKGGREWNRLLGHFGASSNGKSK